LLRHLSSVYKVLTQTVPDAAKNDAVREMEIYLDTMLRQVDSSLMDEWEKMRDPNYVPRGETKEVRPPGAEEADKDVTRDTKAFTGVIRVRVFTFLRSLIIGDFEQAVASMDSSDNAEGGTWNAEQLRAAMEAYRVEHKYLCLDPNARNLRHTYVTISEDKKSWRVQQMLVDPEELNDWVAEFSVDLAQSRAAERPVVTLRKIGPLTAP
jgi:hypothetical protein